MLCNCSARFTQFALQPQAARRRSRLIYPRPPLLGNFTKEIYKFKVKSLKSKPSDGDYVFTTRGLNADAFFRASPVIASALDLRVGRDPFADQIDHNTHSVFDQVKAELSILQKTGSFYFASTV